MSAISRPQVGKLFAVLSALGVTDRDDRIRTLRAVVYRQIASTNDLSRDEGRIAIDLLDSIRRRDDPAAYLARLVETAEGRMPG